MDHSFSFKHDPTIDVMVYKTIAYTGDPSPCCLNFLEVGGQTGLENISETHYKDVVGAFFVYDMSKPETFESLIQARSLWLKYISQILIFTVHL